MDDAEIVELFWQRSESALSETRDKYARYCHAVAFGITRSHHDAEECVNDTWARAWTAIPPARPIMLRTFLGKITRNLALNVVEKASARKRGGGQVPLVLHELDECLPTASQSLDDTGLREALDDFLAGLDPARRKVFVRRYWYASPVDEIARDFGLTHGSVTSTLYRLRGQLRQRLEREGITV